MGLPNKVSGDPKRPSEAKPYDPLPSTAEEEAGDLMLLIALGLGLAGLLFKVKELGWASLFCCISSFANAKTNQLDLKQVVSALTFACFGIFSSYASPRTK